MQSAAKVGLLLVAFVGLLFGAYSILGKSLFGPHPDVYYVSLPDAGGVSEGTEVLMSGVNIGAVGDVKLAGARVARMRLDIQRGVRIPEGSVVQIPVSLIGFGDNPVTIVPPDRQTTVFLTPGSMISGSKGSPIEALLPGSRQTVAELNKTMAAFRKILENEKLQARVVELLDTSNKTLAHFGDLATSANGMLVVNQAKINSAITAATDAVQDVRKVTYRIAELVQGGKLQNDTVAIMDRLKVIARHADELVQSLNKFVNDPKLREPIARSASNVADITETGKKIATNVQTMTKNGTAISENAAVISGKAITLTDKANEIATKASEIEDQLKSVLDKVSGFFSKAPSTGGLSKITTEIDLLRQTDPGYWRTDVTFYYPFQESMLSVGLYDALASNKFTAELSKPLTKRLDLRYGVYASSASVGVDYLLAPRFSLRGDLWEINDPRLDLRTNYDFGNGFIGWLGVDRVLKQNAVTFGVGVRK